MKDSLHILTRCCHWEQKLYIFSLICLCILQNTLPEFFSWEVYIDISCAGVILPPIHCYVWVCIDIFMHIISIFQQYGCVLYMTYSLSVLHLGKLVIYFLCISIILPLYDFTNWHMFTLVYCHFLVLFNDLVVACVETHRFVINLSASHKFPSTLKFPFVS